LTRIAFDSESGNINNYCNGDRNYNDNVKLVYDFKVPQNKRLIFEIHRYEIEAQADCLYDNLTTQGMTTVLTVCGSGEQPLIAISKVNNATIVFESDEDITKCGFNFSWYAVDNDTAFHVGIINDMQGKVSSINFPKAFPDVLSGCHTISPLGDNKVLLEILHLRLPGDDCSTSSLNITLTGANGETYTRQFCGGADVANSTRYLLSDKHVNICVHATSLDIEDGFEIKYDNGKREMLQYYCRYLGMN